ncbi:MAG: VWA domain-containing protein [Butyrivibrio sp.]|nr:VWA domain-containing protein [Butyrivibrio sp.]
MITNPMIPVAVAGPIVLVMFAAFAYGAIRYGATAIRRVAALILAFMICACVFTINLRIMKPDSDSKYTRPNLDVLFVVDTSISMWAKDYGLNKARMDGARDTCNYIMDQLAGSSFALVTFDYESSIRMPLTQDDEYLSDTLDVITVKSIYYAKGTSLNTPYNDMERMLLHMGKKEGHSRIVFFISDGEITNGDELQSYAALADMVDGGAVLGFGTEEGSTMKDVDGYTVRDTENYDEAVSKLDESNLQQVASDLGVEYIHVTDKKDVDSIIANALANAENVEDTQEGLANYEDTYYYLVPVLIVLLLGEVLLSRPAVLKV